MAVKDPYFFVSKDTRLPIDVSDMVLIQILPRMLPNGADHESLTSAAEAAENYVQALVIVQIVS